MKKVMKKFLKVYKMSKGIFIIMDNVKDFPYYFRLFIFNFIYNWKNYEEMCQAYEDAQH